MNIIERVCKIVFTKKSEEKSQINLHEGSKPSEDLIDSIIVVIKKFAKNHRISIDQKMGTIHMTVCSVIKELPQEMQSRHYSRGASVFLSKTKVSFNMYSMELLRNNTKFHIISIEIHNNESIINYKVYNKLYDLRSTIKKDIIK